jgi:hypothetical protein
MLKRPLQADAAFVKGLSSRSTYALLQEMYKTQRSLFIQYARRAIVQLLLNWPIAKSLDEFGDNKMLAQVLRISLSISPFPALQPHADRYARSLDSTVARNDLLIALLNRSGKDNELGKLLLKDVETLLENIVNTKVLCLSHLDVPSPSSFFSQSLMSMTTHSHSRLLFSYHSFFSFLFFFLIFSFLAGCERCFFPNPHHQLASHQSLRYDHARRAIGVP